MKSVEAKLNERYHEMTAERLKRVSSSPPSDEGSFRDCGFDLAYAIPEPSAYSVTLRILQSQAIRPPADIPLKPY